MSKRYLGVCIAMIVAMVVVTAFLYQGWPERVPLHWNYSGQVDKHGPKWIMWLLGPGVLALLFGLGVLAPRWYATHRSAARWMVGVGIAGLLLLATPAPHWVALVLLVAWPVVPVVRSYVLARKNRQTGA
jgi:hypothetical protein